MRKLKKQTIVLAVLLLIIFGQGVVIAKFFAENDERNYTVNIVKINTEKDSVDYLKMKHDLQTIDHTLRRFDAFFRAKHLPDAGIAALRQDSLSQVVYLAKQSNRYSQYLADLERKLQQTPLGNPVGGYISSNFGMRKNPIPTKKPKEDLSLNNIKEDAPKPSDSLGSVATKKPAPKVEKDAVEMQFHKGIDYAIAYGSDVVCTAAGKVIFSGQKTGYGYCVIVSHGNGLDTLYAHLSSIGVKAGQEVRVGQVIAKSGNSGRSTGPHLHYEVRRNGQPINPKLFLGLSFP